EVDLDCLQSTRAILGWCTAAVCILGSRAANYEIIDYSGATEMTRSVNLAGGALGIQQFGLAQLDFKLGPKDGKFHFQRRGPYQRIIQLAGRTPVLLYDTADKRGWLVAASDVILHMCHHRHALEPFPINGTAV